MCNFFIYNTQRMPVGILQNFTSVQWVENYNTVGEVKITALNTAENLALLTSGNRIYNSDSDTVARICDVEIVKNESEELINVRAVLTASLLGERVVMATENITNAEAGMYSCYTKNQRGLPIKASSMQNFTEETVTEFTWVPVLEAVTKIAEMSGLGFKVVFDFDTCEETFVVYKGVNRCDDTADTYEGYFGTDVGNIENANIVFGDVDLKNVAIVAGEEEGEEENKTRVVHTVYAGTASGEEQRELYVDASDLKHEYEVANETGEIDENGNPKIEYTKARYSDAEYSAMLDARGYEELAKHMETFTITCDIVQNNIEYGVGYNLGDILPIKLVEYGINATARVASVLHTYETSSNKTAVTLSEFTIINSGLLKNII